MHQAISWAVGAVYVLACYSLGMMAVAISGVAFPGALIGLMLLLFLLFIIPSAERHIACFVTLPLRHMSLFFVPAVLGVSLYWGDIKSNAVSLVIAIVITTVVSFGFTAVFSQKLLHNKKEKIRTSCEASNTTVNGKHTGINKR